MKDDKICITRKVSKIFAQHTFFKQIHNINNENIQIYIHDNTFGNVYGALLDGLKGDEDIITAFGFSSQDSFSHEGRCIEKYTYKEYENIIDEFINYEFNISTFRTFLINILLSKYRRKCYAWFVFSNPETGDIVEYQIYISRDDEPIKIIVTHGFYLIG